MIFLEFAPTIISLILAGKVGSSIAGNLGTMKVTEQIDALEIMGVNPQSYLIMPKMVAALFVFPFIVIVSIFLGTLGGYLASLLTGVVSGIGGYGNCMGVPTVGGEVEFNSCYNDNILVNAMCVGIAKINKIFYSKASGIGNSVVYVGSKTGRDGIHGATMASAEFDDSSDEKRPTVQVGDPFAEKLLLEACLELMKEDIIIAIQDMGAAGLTSSAVEMASKGNVGIDLNLDNLPCRETFMTAYEMMLSESQERMLMIIEPEKEKEAKSVFDKWGLDFATIGVLTDTNRIIINHENEKKADIPLNILESGAPSYDRPYKIVTNSEVDQSYLLKSDEKIINILRKLISSPNLCSRR